MNNPVNTLWSDIWNALEGETQLEDMCHNVLEIPLISAAPELLSALQAMVQWQMDSMSGKETKGYPGTQAMNAIKKAIGEQHETN